MKHITTLTILTALVLGIPLVQVSAQEAVTTDAVETTDVRPTVKDRLQKMKDAREDHKENVEERKANMEETRAEHKGEITDAVKTKIVERLNRAKERMTAMTNRFNKIIDRIDSRINRLTEKGVDTTEAIRLVADARVAVSTAQSTIDSIDPDTIVASESIREAVQEAKVSMKSVKESLRSAHIALKDAVKSLRANVSTDSQSE